MATALLDDLDTYLAAVHAALDDPEWDGSLPDAPLLDTDIAPGDRDRVISMIEAIGAAQRILRKRMATAREELGDMEPRRTAARRYLQQETFSA